MPNHLTFKKSNCKNCYKCIRHCPVKAIRFSGNQAHIIGNECILCGQCFVVCPQNAKEIASELEKVKVLLQSGDPVVVSLAPSFIANYNDVGIDSMREALKKLGFYDVEETAIGAHIVKTEYERILREEERDIVITSCCHSINLLIQKYYPMLLPYLADVVSPMQAHCMDIKKRIPKAKTVFVGPCVAKKDEAEHYEGIVDAVLTFEELTEWLRDERITLKEEMDHTPQSRTRFFPTAGGVLQTMAKGIAGYTYMAFDGVENCISALANICSGKIHKCFIEMNACSGGCIGDLLTIGSGSLFAAHIIAVERCQKNTDTYALIVLQFAFSAGFALIYSLFFERGMPVTIEVSTAGGLLYLAVFSTTIAMSLQNIGQSMAPSSHAAILLSLESVFGALASWLLLGERLTGMMIVGFAIIFAALVVNSLKS